MFIKDNMTQIFKHFALVTVLMSMFVGGLSVSPVFAADPTDFDPTSLDRINDVARSPVDAAALIKAQAVTPTTPVNGATTPIEVEPRPSDAICSRPSGGTFANGCPCDINGAGTVVLGKCISNAAIEASKNPGNPNPSTPSTSSPSTGASGCVGDNLKDCYNVFRAKCIFPTGIPDGATSSTTACKLEDSVVGILQLYLQNIIPYLAVAVIAFAGYVFYSSSTSGDSKRAVGAIRAAVSGLVFLLFTSVVSDIYRSLNTAPTGGQSGKGIDMILGIDGTLMLGIINTVKLVFNLLQYVAGAIAVVSILYAGYLYILGNFQGAKGSDGTAAKNALRNAVIGLIVTLLATTIVGFIQNFTQQFIK